MRPAHPEPDAPDYPLRVRFPNDGHPNWISKLERQGHASRSPTASDKVLYGNAHLAILPPVIGLELGEGREDFDRLAREWVGMSGDGFVRRLDAGEFAEMPDDDDHRLHIELALMSSLGRSNEPGEVNVREEKSVAMASLPSPMDEFESDQELDEGEVFPLDEELR